MQNEAFEPLPYKTVSADSHVTEPPNCYIDYIDPKYRAIAGVGSVEDITQRAFAALSS